MRGWPVGSTMGLTPHQHDQLTAWVDDHFPEGMRCPLCRGMRWEPGEIMTGLPVDPAAVTHMTGLIRPVVQLCCLACRNVVFFEAGAVGLLTPE
jgi:hypothetical protein